MVLPPLCEEQDNRNTVPSSNVTERFSLDNATAL